MAGWTKDGKAYCTVCNKKTTEFDVTHGGAIVEIEKMKYPVCTCCIKRKSEVVIKKIKERRNG
nr:MAG TPA: antitoxin [Bacteriophage sp.]